VIAHELAHVRRLDVLANLLQTVAEALLFYHPAVWWLGRRIRIEREHCCDEVAVSLYGNRLEYARALGLMQQWRAAPRLAVAANHGELGERILCVLGRQSAVYRPQPVGALAGMLFLLAALSASQLMPAAHFPALKRAVMIHALVPAPVMAAIEAPVAVMPVIEHGQKMMTASPIMRVPQPQSVAADAVNPLADTVPDAPAPVLAEDAAPPVAADAGQTVCIKPQQQSASRLLAPPRCFTQAQWRQILDGSARRDLFSLNGQGLRANAHVGLNGE
jgi:hypothetical protein